MRISDWSSDVCSSDLSYIAILFGITAGNDLALLKTQNGNRHVAAIVLKQASHSHFFRDHASTHDQFSQQRPHSTGAYPLKKRSEEHTSELQSLMRISYAAFCLQKTNKINTILINN